MTTAEAIEVGTKKLNIGCGKHPIEGFVNLDMCFHPGVDVLYDLNDCGKIQMPFADDTFDSIFASHVLEHVPNPLPMMQELHRITKPGGFATFKTPYGSTDDAYENPTHVKQYFFGSFAYFSQPLYWREDYNYRGDWRPEEIVLQFRDEDYPRTGNDDALNAKMWDDVKYKRNVVTQMIATLSCVKPIREPLMNLQTVPKISFQIVKVQ